MPWKRSYDKLGYFKQFETQKIEIDLLIIETQRHIYTPEYVALTKDFYLKCNYIQLFG